MSDIIAEELRITRKQLVRLNRKLSLQRISGKVSDRDPQTRKVRLEIGDDPETGEKIKSPWVRVQGLSAGSFKLSVLPSVGEQLYLESPDGVIGADSLATFGAFDNENRAPDQEPDELVLENGNTRFSLKNGQMQLKCGNSTIDIAPGKMTMSNGSTVFDLTDNSLDMTSSLFSVNAAAWNYTGQGYSFSLDQSGYSMSAPKFKVKAARYEFE